MKDVQITANDMKLIPRILPYRSPADVPLTFRLGDEVIHGIPARFNPTITTHLVDCNMVQTVIEGQDESGLSIRAEYLEYRDFPVTEWLVFLTNRGKEKTPILSDIRVGGEIPCKKPVLTHGNGDTCTPDGYTFFDTPVTEKITLQPTSGTSCHGAFPYMTLHLDDCEIRAAIGFPARWIAEIEPTAQGVRYLCGQARCHFTLLPGETFRTPRLTLMAYEAPDAFRGINLWRKWYLKHILPRENGQPIGPKLCLHYFMADGKPEFTGASEENQIPALHAYLNRGIKPDIWWMDAGWYPCDYDWPRVGTWRPDEKRFPNGLAPLGRACEENGVQLMVWFEPERVRAGEELEREHPDWILHNRNSDGSWNGLDGLLNLGNPDALAWLKDHVNRLIDENHIAIYRQDFNFDPAPIWEKNEQPDRVGMLENSHAQGYLSYWDSLILNHPGLWIDSCASGGRRNDLETMRRAVPLHYTDVGYGNHPIKLKQHREMFEWIPYFRAHNMDWYNEETGNYDNGAHPVRETAFHCALTPAMTDMHTYCDTEENIALSRKMIPIWREAAGMELRGNYYPMTECRGDAADDYAMQFDCPKTGEGFFQVIRGAHSEKDTFRVVLPCLHTGAVYTLTDREHGKVLTFTAEQLARGFDVSLARREGVVYFYKVEK